MRACLGLLSLLLLACSSAAPKIEHAPPAPEPAHPESLLRHERSPVDKLTFLAGAWEGVDGGGNRIDEHWTQSRGGMLFGINRLTMDSTVAMYEYMRIESRDDDSLVLVVQPRGGEPIEFKYASGGWRFAVFANHGNRWPKRILYGRNGDNLHVRFEGDADDIMEHLVLKAASVERGR